MRTPVKLVAFGTILVGAFGIASAIGAAVGPIDVGGSPDHQDMPATTVEVPHGHDD